VAVVAALAIPSAALSVVATTAAGAAPQTLISDPFTHPTTSSPLIVPAGPSATAGFPCLTAGTNPTATPVPGCNFTPPDADGSGTLRFTNAVTNEDSAAFYNATIPTSAGLSITFDQYQYGGNGADGISFDLAVAPPEPSAVGAGGGSLGYAGAANSPTPGFPAGWLGIGFDVFGNYLNSSFDGKGCTATSYEGPGIRVPNQVTVRGPGNGNTGYCVLSSSAQLNPDPLGAQGIRLHGSSRATALRAVQITIDPSNNDYSVGIDSSGGTNYTPVTSGTLPGAYYDPTTGQLTNGVPPRITFGFAGSTGALTDIHEISNVNITTLNGGVPVLGLSTSDSLAAQPAPPGSGFSYTIQPSITGSTSETEPLTVTDPLPAHETTSGSVGDGGTQWNCSNSTSTNVSCSYIGPLPLTSASSIDPITVPVSLDSSAPPGPLGNTATVSSLDAATSVTATDTIQVEGTATVALTTTQPTVPSGAQVVPDGALPPSTLQSTNTSSAQAVASAPLHSIGTAPPAGTSSSPLGSIPLGSIPLHSIPLGSIPLHSITLAEAPLTASSGTTWAALLSCANQPVGASCATTYAGLPEQTLTLSQVLSLPQVQSLPLGSIDLSATPLASIPLASIALGSIPLGSIPISGPGPDATANWCAVITAAGQSCAAGSALDPATATLLAVSLAGIPLHSIPLGSITLAGIQSAIVGDPQSAPLGSIPLGSIDVGSTPLHSIPLGSINFASTPLGSIPLGSIPLGSIPLHSIPLGSIPLHSIPLGSIPLGSILLSSIPAATLSSVIACNPGAANDPCAVSTLGQVPPSAFTGDLDALCSGSTACGSSTLAQLCLQNDTTNSQPLCGEAAYETQLSQLGGPGFGYGGTTFAELLAALPPSVLAQILLGDVLTGLLNRADYPWQDLNLQDPALETSANNGGVATYQAVITVTGGPVAATLNVTLPGGFHYLPGSSVLAPATGGSVTVADPTASGSTLTWTLSLPVGMNTLSFKAPAGLDLGAATASATVSTTSAPAGAAAGATVSVVDAFAPGYHSSSTPDPLSPDTITLGYIPQPATTDWFSLNVAAGQELSLSLSNLPADYDLTLYSPPPAQIQNAPVQILPPVQDPPSTENPDSAVTPPVPAQDLSTVNLPVYAISDNRGTADEVINTSPLTAGNYLIEVSGYNGASSPNPFVLRAKLLNGPGAASCVAPRALTGLTPLLNMPTLPANVNTIFLANTERLAALYSTGDAQAILSDAATVASDNADGVIGAVIPVETQGNVAADYAAWDASRCSVTAANAVVSDIAKVVDALRAAHPTIKNVVILGDDSQIPMARVPDSTTLSNETSFAQDFIGPENELTASLAGGYVLTDAPYVNPTPLGVGIGSLFVPEIAIGRLVSTPAEIEASLTQFTTRHGILSDGTGLSTGYDFLGPGAQAAAANLGLVPARQITQLISNTNCTPQPPVVSGPTPGSTWPAPDCWTSDNLSSGLLNNPKLVGLNAHFDYGRLLPANGNQTGNQTSGLFQTTDLRALVSAHSGLLAGSLLFSMGCHAGLEVPQNEIGMPVDTWVNTFADEGALWVANTGYGYGDTTSVAYSVQLMANFARYLDESATVGDALAFAKQQYVGNLAVVSPYDMKAEMESTLYGLPMYRLHAAPTPPAPRPAGPTTTTDPLASNLTVASFKVDNLSVGSNPGQLGLVQPNGPSGPSYYQLNGTTPTNGQIQATEYRPIQPKVTVDVTQPTASGNGLALVAHGALLTNLCSQDVSPFTPTIVRPTIDSTTNEPGLTGTNVDFPSELQTVTTYLAPNGQHQQVVLVPGQFNGTKSTERLFTCLDGLVYYANPSDPVAATDFVPPNIVSTQGQVVGNAASFTVSVTPGMASEPVRRVTVLFTSGNGVWTRADLTQTPAGTWTGGGPAQAGSVLAYFVQAVDGAGNVGVASDKGTYYAAPPAGNVTGSVTISVPPPPASGFYAGPVAAMLTEPNGTAPITYTLDGVTTSGVAPGTTVTVSGDGDHVLSAFVPGGSVSTVSIPIDAGPPQIVVSAPPVDGTGTYIIHQNVLASFGCTDALAITSCSGLVDGTIPVSPDGLLPTSTVGHHTLVITAVDAAGQQATLSVPYTVTYAICPVMRLVYRAGHQESIAVYLCGAAGVNWSTGVRVTAVSLNGGTVPPNQLTGNTRFLWVPTKVPAGFPPLPFLRVYAYLMNPLPAGQYTLAITVAGDPVSHQVTFAVKS
jgi:hypothetical protein